MPTIIGLPRLSIVASLSDDPGFLELMAYQFNGLIVVFVALGSIWMLLEIVGAFFKRAARRALSLEAPVVSAKEEVQPDTAIIAVIAAAVHDVLGKATRIVEVKPAEPDRDWAREGRRQIFSSHKIR